MYGKQRGGPSSPCVQYGMTKAKLAKPIKSTKCFWLAFAIHFNGLL